MSALACCTCGHGIDAHSGFVNMSGCLDCACSKRPSDFYDQGWADGYNKAKTEILVAAPLPSEVTA